MKHLIVIGVPLLLAGSAIEAHSDHSSLKWMDAPSSLPKGAQMAVVSGDPSKKGMFTIELQLPVNYYLPAHWLPADEVLKPLSGKVHYGLGDKPGATTLNAGESATIKAKMSHWVHAPVPATLEVSGMGPFQITYVNAKDDPRNK